MNTTRYFIQLAYDGGAFHGWQIQPNASSVQDTLQRALTTMLRQEINIVGCGRTDAGVHASYFVAHFDAVPFNIPVGDLAFKLNRFLPSSITVRTVFPVSGEDHARFSPVARTYHYVITQKKSPFLKDYAYFYPYSLDIDLMNKAANAMLNYTDFTSFSKLHTDVKTNNCDLMKARWYQQGDLLVFEVQADRFLRNMVRAIVGTLMEVGRGKANIEDVCRIIEAKDRGAAGASAEGQGLFLTHVQYADHLDAKLDAMELPFL